MRRRALPVAFALALLMLSPKYFWLWMPLAGAAVVWLHRMRTNEAVSTRAGLRIGAFTGAVAFAIWSAVLASTVIYDRMVLDRQDRLTQGLRLSLQEFGKRNPDPETQRRVAEVLSNPEAMAVYAAVTVILMGVLFVSLCATGGALGSSLSSPRPDV
jgi:hypothetical protein